MTTSHTHRDRRRGAILLVVLALLALFAVIGLSFVLFAESEGTAGRIYRESKSTAGPLDPADAAGRAITQMVWGTDDLASVARGNDLATLMYGTLGEVPYNGVGRVHEDLTIPAVSASNKFTMNRAEVVNYTAAAYYDNATTSYRAVVDPEHVSKTAGRVRNEKDGTFTTSLTDPTKFVAYGKNAPFTYVDRGNILVGLTDPSTGRAVMPSAHRPTLFLPAALQTSPTTGLTTQTPDWFGTPANNPNWSNLSGRLKTLRPRRVDHLTAAERATFGTVTETPTAAQQAMLTDGGANAVGKFPYPPKNPDGSVTGDVQNLRYADGTQRNDSVWLDLNLPIVTDPRGRRLVPLVAPLMVPLDNRVNLNVAGNLVSDGAMMPTYAHRSAAGFGPHEVNPAWLSNLVTGTTLPPANPNNTPPTAAGNAQQYTYTRFGATGPAATPSTPSGVNQLSFQTAGAANASIPPASYAQVPWDGRASAPPTYPTATGSAPDFSTAAYNTANPELSHPALWNPYERTSFSANDLTAAGAYKTYPVSDLRLFGGRYSAKQASYASQTFLANDNRGTTSAFLKDFLGDGSAYSAAAGSGPGSKGNLARSLVTPVSNSRAVAGTGYVWGGGQSFQYDPTTQTAPALAVGNQLDLTALTVAATSAQGDTAQVATGGQAAARNLRAVLGPVDVNRKLADYRANVTQPLSGTNLDTTVPTGQSVTQAVADRQTLARDIFLRLAVVTGAKLGYDSTRPDVPAADTDSYYGKYVLPRPNGMGGYELPVGATPYPAVSQQEYDALRWLAQLAANIVDYVDTDDVSTTFVWNPSNGLDPFQAPTSGVSPFSAMATAPAKAELSERVVFGTERPRLVLNEAYAEVANDKADKSGPRASKDFRVRFWVEVLNPLNAESATPANNPLLGPDNAGGVALAQSGATPAYRLQIFDLGTPVLNQLKQAGNVTGWVNASDGTYPLSGSKITTTATAADQANRLNCSLANLTPAPGNPSAAYVEANGGQGSANWSAMPPARNGFAVIGPQVNKGNASDGVAFTPDDSTGMTAQPFSLALYKPENTGTLASADPDALDYFVARATAANIKTQAVDPLNTDPNRHVVLLRRLANPYLAPNDPTDTAGFNPAQPVNPYLTVDVLSQVPVFDGVKYGNDPVGPANNNSAQSQNADQRYAVGRVQPYAGYQDEVAAGQTPQYQYPNGSATTPTLTLKQQGTVAGTTVGGKDPKMSFFRHNSQNATPPTGPNDPAGMGADPTLLTPFDWLAHLDRKLVSPAELLFVSAAPPHRLTRQFLTPLAPAGMANPPVTVVRHTHDLQHHSVTATDPMTMAVVTFTPAGPLADPLSPLYRMLDVLQVKPWTINTPLSGRQAGKQNINFLFDGDASGTNPSKVFRAVMDAQAGNGFTTADVDTLWKNLLRSRSPGWQTNGGTVQPVIQPTADELTLDPMGNVVGVTDPTKFDRPFKGLGAGLFTLPVTSTDAGVKFPGTIPTTSMTSAPFRTPGLEDTLLRSLPVDAAGATVTTASNSTGLFQNPTAPAAMTGDHPMRQWEPLRKAFNSLTTTTDTYLLLLTVGYFEVDESNGGRVLRAEAYDQSPGDLRAQFVAVLDRTNLGADATAVLNQAASPQAVTQSTRTPLVLELQAAVTVPPLPMMGTRPATTVTVPGTIDNSTGTPRATGTYDGATWTIQQNDQFFVGTGDQQNLMTVASVAAGATAGTVDIQATFVEGLAAPNVALGTPRPHAAGEMVSNMRFRNPGPQPGKVLRPDRPDPVVRLFTELK